MKHGLIVADISKDSIGQELGIEKGDKILTIDGTPLKDLIDYKFLISDENLQIEVEKSNGELWEFEIEKDFDEDLGISFESYTADEIRRCGNKCIFCFVDQMAPNMRETLYVKDDDYRWSFLQGNFVTLTNLKEEALDRIIRMRLSPLYISVHTTNPELRAKMLNNPRAKEINNILAKLRDSDLEVHTQVVLCPEVNDGPELDRTINDLKALWPNVASLAIVPVGLTKYREGLYKARKFTSQEARNIINQVRIYQEKCKEEFGNTFVYLSDEFYLLADETVPLKEVYEDFPQIENGVGLVRLFIDDFAEFEPSMPEKINLGKGKETRKITLATGVSGGKVLKPLVERLNQIQGLSVQLKVIPNHFFGTDVTVTGLITGSDIIRELKGQELGEELLLPRVMLKSGEIVFLDDSTIASIETELGCNISIVEDNAKDMVNKILGLEVA